MPPRAPSGRAKRARATRGTPAGRSRKIDVPARQQDGLDLSAVIAQSIAEQQVEPLETRIAALEAAVASFSALAVYQADLTLRAGGRSGAVMLERAFTEDEIGQPVLMVQAATVRGDEAEAGVVEFVARVLDGRRMRVFWSCPFPAPRHVHVVYQVLAGDVVGRLAALWAPQLANRILAGPASGDAAAPTFRPLEVADLPAEVGTVQSVELSAPAEFTVTGSPITATGIVGLLWTLVAATKVFSGPTTGDPAAPTFRSLGLADLPVGLALLGAANAFGAFNQTFDGDVLVIDAVNNRVGIGVAAPAYKLEIKGAGGANKLTITDTNASGRNVGFNNGGAGIGGAGYFSIDDNTTPNNLVIFEPDGTVVIVNAARLHTLGAYAAGDKYVVADASGNLHLSALGPGS